MSYKNKDIETGARICARLKQYYYRDVAWVDCYKDVADKFGVLKRIARPYYKDLSYTEFLFKLSTYNLTEMNEAFENN